MIIGTTVTPYMQLYQAAAVADRGVGPDEYPETRADTIIGTVFANLIAMSIIIATGATIGGTGPLTSASDAAQALANLLAYASLANVDSVLVNVRFRDPTMMVNINSANEVALRAFFVSIVYWVTQGIVLALFARLLSVTKVQLACQAYLYAHFGRSSFINVDYAQNKQSICTQKAPPLSLLSKQNPSQVLLAAGWMRRRTKERVQRSKSARAAALGKG